MSDVCSESRCDGHSSAIAVIRILRQHGHQAYLAGGCVRDILLGIEPKDFDVATDAKPDEIGGYFRKTAAVGAAFGVMLVRDFGEMIEVATFRSDGAYSDSRRPDSVEFSSPQEDAQRRDFTINALFMDPLSDDEEHTMIDYVDGVSDIRDRVLRAVGTPADRLREDHLRALRGVRFAAKYELEIEQQTLRAIKEHARELSGVSIERIGEELRKMLLHPTRVRSCILIDELGLAGAIFGDDAQFDPHVMDSLPAEAPYALVLAALAIGRGSVAGGHAEAICTGYRKALDLSNSDRDLMRAILGCLAECELHWSAMGEASRKRLASKPAAGLALIILDSMDPDLATSIHSEIERLSARFGGLSPVPYLNGADLIELGITPGPVFKAILDEVYDEQLEGRVDSQPKAIEFVQDRVK